MLVLYMQLEEAGGEAICSLQRPDDVVLTLNSSSLVFSSAPSAPHSIVETSDPDANTYQPFKTVSNAVLNGFQQHLLESKDELSLPPSAGIVSSLSQALCHINRLNLSTTSSGGGEEDRKSTNARAFQSRVLILTASPDSSSQYVSVMNCIFGAQKRVSDIFSHK